ncbi:MAG: hypothetical protein GC193_03925 [Cryomorphaceae bacterium]|nr:hypothetical protein [Cryomorphaceae bacterium]
MKDLGVFVLASSLSVVAIYLIGKTEILGGHDTTDNLNESFLAAGCAINAVIAFVRGYLFFEPLDNINTLDEEQSIQVSQPAYSLFWIQIIHPLGLLISMSLLTYIIMFSFETFHGDVVAWFTTDILKSSLLLSAGVAILLASTFHIRHLNMRTT